MNKAWRSLSMASDCPKLIPMSQNSASYSPSSPRFPRYSYPGTVSLVSPSFSSPSNTSSSPNPRASRPTVLLPPVPATFPKPPPSSGSSRGGFGLSNRMSSIRIFTPRPAMAFSHWQRGVAKPYADSTSLLNSAFQLSSSFITPSCGTSGKTAFVLSCLALGLVASKVTSSTSTVAMS